MDPRDFGYPLAFCVVAVASGCGVCRLQVFCLGRQPLYLPPPAVIQSSQLLCHLLQPSHFVLRGGQSQKQINNQHTPPPSWPGLRGKEASQSSGSGLLLPYQKTCILFPLEGALSPKQSQPCTGVGILKSSLNRDRTQLPTTGLLWGVSQFFPKAKALRTVMFIPPQIPCLSVFDFTLSAPPRAGFPNLQALLCQPLMCQNEWIYQCLSQVNDCSRDKT